MTKIEKMLRDALEEAKKGKWDMSASDIGYIVNELKITENYLSLKDEREDGKKSIRFLLEEVRP